MRNFHVMDIQNHHKPASHKSPSPKATTHFLKELDASGSRPGSSDAKRACVRNVRQVRRKWGRVRLWKGLGGGIGCLRRVRLCKLVGRWTRLRPVSGRANNPRTDFRARFARIYHRTSYTSPTVWLAQTRDKQIPASIPTISKIQVCQIGWHRDFEEICETCALRKWSYCFGQIMESQTNNLFSHRFCHTCGWVSAGAWRVRKAVSGSVTGQAASLSNERVPKSPPRGAPSETATAHPSKLCLDE